MYILKTGEAQPLYLDEYLLAYRVKKNRHGMKPERKLEFKSDFTRLEDAGEIQN